MKVILASHGNLAEGMLNSAEIILGSDIKDRCTCLCAYTSDGYNLEREVENILDEYENEKDLVVVTDVFGGSVNNEFIKYLSSNNFTLVSGMNLPMILELLPQSSKLSKEQIKHLIFNSREFIIDCNSILKDECEVNEF